MRVAILTSALVLLHIMECVLSIYTQSKSVFIGYSDN